MLFGERYWWAVGLLCLVACPSDDSGELGGSATDASGVSDGDPGVSVGASAGDGGDGGDPDSGGGGPENEEDGDFQIPQASGRYVYSTAAMLGVVAVIDSETLGIEVVGVGQEPTVVRPLGEGGDSGAVAVLNAGSDEVSVLRTDAAGTAPVDQREITPGANNLAVSPNGAYVIAYHDVDGPSPPGPGSDQEVTVLLSAAGGDRFEMTVGAHPRDIRFSPNSARAYVVTADGVNVLQLDQLTAGDKPDVIPVVDDPGTDPDRIEVVVAARHGVAVARVEDVPALIVTDLSSGTRTTFDLETPPTDIDLSQDESSVVATLRQVGGSTLAELALPGAMNVRLSPVGSEFVGLAELSWDGQTAVLYTTVAFPEDMEEEEGTSGVGPVGTSTGTGTGGPGSTGGTTGTGAQTGTGDAEPEGPPSADPRNRVTILRRDGSAWGDPITLFNDVGIRSVGIAPDNASAILIHELDDDDAASAAPWSYTLIDLSKEFPVKKRQNVEAATGSVLFTPSGDRAVVLIRADATAVKRSDRIDLRTFVVDALGFGSPPEGAGFVASTGKVFVSQEHPSGRITFIGGDGLVETLTGYVLNDAVKD